MSSRAPAILSTPRIGASRGRDPVSLGFWMQPVLFKVATRPPNPALWVVWQMCVVSCFVALWGLVARQPDVVVRAAVAAFPLTAVAMAGVLLVSVAVERRAADVGWGPLRLRNDALTWHLHGWTPAPGLPRQVREHIDRVVSADPGLARELAARLSPRLPGGPEFDEAPDAGWERDMTCRMASLLAAAGHDGSAAAVIDGAEEGSSAGAGDVGQERRLARFVHPVPGTGDSGLLLDPVGAGLVAGVIGFGASAVLVMLTMWRESAPVFLVVLGVVAVVSAWSGVMMTGSRRAAGEAMRRRCVDAGVESWEVPSPWLPFVGELHWLDWASAWERDGAGRR